MNNRDKEIIDNKYPWLRPFLDRYTKGFLIIWLLGAVGFVLTIGLLALTGQIVLNPDAEVTEFSVCLTKAFEPVEAIPINVEQFYVCGLIEGTTRYSATLTIMYRGEVLYWENVTVYPEHFYVPIEISERYVLGEYVATLAQSRDKQMFTEFLVVVDLEERDGGVAMQDR